jgi:hypothetical protein
MIKKLIFISTFVVLATACTAQQQSIPPQPSSPSVPTAPTAPAVPSSPPVSTAPLGSASVADATLKNQEWGNDSLVLDIGTDSSTVSLACSNGEITEPFTVSHGQFSLNGTYHPEGPPRASIGSDGQPEANDYSSTFTGSIEDGVMHFTIGSGGSEYDLTQGKFTLRNEPCPL